MKKLLMVTTLVAFYGANAYGINIVNESKDDLRYQIKSGYNLVAGQLIKPEGTEKIRVSDLSPKDEIEITVFPNTLESAHDWGLDYEALKSRVTRTITFQPLKENSKDTFENVILTYKLENFKSSEASLDFTFENDNIEFGRKHTIK